MFLATYDRKTILAGNKKNFFQLELPPDVAFRISGDTKIQWLVLQVHYASVKHIPESGDTTSIGIEYQGPRWFLISRRPNGALYPSKSL